MNKNVREIYDRAKADLHQDFERTLERLKEAEGTDVGVFMEKLLEWKYKKGSTHSQLAWEIFHRAIEIENEKCFFGSLNSFVGNCLLDDSYFAIEWRKPDYLYKTEVYGGIEVQAPELQWLPGGEFKTMLTTKDDPKGKPVVVWAHDDNGTQNAKLLLEAMDIAEERAIQRLKDLEELEEQKDELIAKIRKGED
jgi:hypothetical protein